MPFLWNQGTLHKHVWKCPNCNFTLEFNSREWAYREIHEHKSNCQKRKGEKVE
jgi:hypothetical protein